MKSHGTKVIVVLFKATHVHTKTHSLFPKKQRIRDPRNGVLQLILDINMLKCPSTLSILPQNIN